MEGTNHVVQRRCVMGQTPKPLYTHACPLCIMMSRVQVDWLRRHRPGLFSRRYGRTSFCGGARHKMTVHDRWRVMYDICPAVCPVDVFGDDVYDC